MSEVSREVVKKLNEIFNEQWDIDNLEGALKGIELVVNQMATDLLEANEERQLRMTSMNFALGYASSKDITRQELLDVATSIEDYIKNG